MSEWEVAGENGHRVRVSGATDELEAFELALEFDPDIEQGSVIPAPPAVGWDGGDPHDAEKAGAIR